MAAGILAWSGKGLVAWAVAVAAALAGCIGGSESDPAASPNDDAATGGATDGGSAPGLPADGGNGTGAGVAAEPALPDLVPRALPFSWDGSVGAHLCIPSGIHSCQYVEISAGAPRTEFALEALPVSFSLELTWTGTPVVSDRLSVALTFLGAEPDRGLGSVSGTSPLPLAGDNLTLAGEPSFALTVQPLNPPIVLDGRVHPEQAFHLEGTFTVMVPAAQA